MKMELEVAILAHCFQITLKFGVLAFVGGKPEDLEKNSTGKDKKQQQTWPTCDTRCG